MRLAQCVGACPQVLDRLAGDQEPHGAQSYASVRAELLVERQQRIEVLAAVRGAPCAWHGWQAQQAADLAEAAAAELHEAAITQK